MTSPLRYRFVRLNPRFDRDETLGLLKSEIKQQPLPVSWFNSKQLQLEFFAIPGEFCLNRSTSFQSGRVYGLDVTSGAAVAALLFDIFDRDVQNVMRHEQQQRVVGRVGDAPLRVLDLCCAPGLKLCMMADLSPPSSIIVGVDTSSQRISLCKNIVKKYQIDCITSGQPIAKSNNQSRVSIRLYHADGTTFGTNDSKANHMHHGLVFDSTAALEDIQSRGKRKRTNKSTRAREKRNLSELQRREVCANANTNIIGDDLVGKGMESVSKNEFQSDSERTFTVPQFDRVLVDAECSTDGATRHHIEKQQYSCQTLRRPVWDDGNMDELVDLQKRLIRSGFRLLKSGGILVYSTCSLSSKQNEQVVLSLLHEYHDSFIIPLSFCTCDKSIQETPFIEQGSIPGTIRFNPLVYDAKDAHDASRDCIHPGSGFFLAKIGKR
jgi:16S rRNA C967 or C1407 C5-methylase (RsmB/RsmF family)